MDQNHQQLQEKSNTNNMIERSQYKVGEFLYGIPTSEECEKYNPKDQRVFIHNGYKTGDGYGVLIGWFDGKLIKSTGWKNVCWGGGVRRATQLEIEFFMEKLMEQDNIKNR